MSRVSIVAMLLAVVVLLSVPAIRSFADDTLTVKQVMDKYHKGKEAPVQTVLAGKADAALLKELLAAYQSMAAQKPSQGDEAVWKTKTNALVEATQGLIDKKADAAAAFKTAVDCKACHSVYKPKK